MFVAINLIMDDVMARECNPACSGDLCCSQYGNCGAGPAYCGGGVAGQLSQGMEGAPCIPPCREGECCSKYGYCGTSEDHCNH